MDVPHLEKMTSNHPIPHSLKEALNIYSEVRSWFPGVGRTYGLASSISSPEYPHTYLLS